MLFLLHPAYTALHSMTGMVLCVGFAVLVDRASDKLHPRPFILTHRHKVIICLNLRSLLSAPNGDIIAFIRLILQDCVGKIARFVHCVVVFLDWPVVGGFFVPPI